MADKSQIDFDIAAVKEAFLKKTFLISEDPIYDYYQTNSGMYPKNPGSGGGGGGGGDLSSRVADLEASQKRQDEDIATVSTDVDAVVVVQNNIADAARHGLETLSDFVLSNDPKYDEIDDIISDQDILKKTQENFLSAVIDAQS